MKTMQRKQERSFTICDLSYIFGLYQNNRIQISPPCCSIKDLPKFKFNKINLKYERSLTIMHSEPQVNKGVEQEDNVL